MFEKEAEEYAKQNNPAEYGVRATHFTVLNSFKDGAEFGYNKAKEEIGKYKEMIEDMKADMCSTESEILCDYLVGILKKYGEIV